MDLEGYHINGLLFFKCDIWLQIWRGNLNEVKKPSTQYDILEVQTRWQENIQYKKPCTYWMCILFIIVGIVELKEMGLIFYASKYKGGEG